MSSAPTALSRPPTKKQRSGASRFIRGGERGILAIAMFVCAFALWTLAPWLAIRGVPQIVGSVQTADGGNVLPLIQIVTAAAVIIVLGLVLARLNAIYCRLIAREERPHLEAAWRRPLTNEHEGEQAAGLLELVLTMSLAVAVVAFMGWFLLFAECTNATC